jgi:hypothetical protein
MAKLFDKVTTDQATIVKMGDALISTFNSLKSHVHIWLSSCVLHAIEHGDYTEIPRVLNEMGEGFKKKAVYQWLTLKKKGETIERLPFIWVLKTDDTPAHLALDTELVKDFRARYNADKDAMTALIFGLKPWYKFDMQNEEMRPFNLRQELARIQARAAKAASDEKVKANKDSDFTGLAEFVAFVDSLSKKGKAPAKPVTVAPIAQPEEDDGSASPADAAASHAVH